MGVTTGISWTDSTWNPIRGCSRVSEGCRHCYAERHAYRFSGPGLAYEGLVQVKKDKEGLAERLPLWNGQIKFVEEHLLDPLRWKKPRRVFVNSMSDLFHENCTDEMRDKIFAVMALCPQHTFQVLTKRPERMLEYFNRKDRGERSKLVTNPSAWFVWNAATAIQAAAKKSIPGPFHWTTFDDPDTVAPWPLPNVHLGVSVENQATADQRIPLLLQTPAAVRFISAEPLLGPVELTAVPEIDLPGVAVGTPLLHWVIVGGESGAGARPMHPDWARSLRDQCTAAGVPFFFKQWGEWLPLTQRPPADTNPTYRNYCMLHRDGSISSDMETCPPISAGVGYGMARVGTKAAGCLLDGVERHEFPEVTRGTL
jgi:protein gp37